MSEISLGEHRFLLGYGTNVHRTATLPELETALAAHAEAVKARFSPDKPMGLNLCLGAPAVRELTAANKTLDAFRGKLDRAGLFVFSINAFPMGDFHAARVKEEVYRPDWREPERGAGTLLRARVLAALLPEGMTGSLSAPSGTWKAWADDDEARRAMARNIAAVVVELARLEKKRGRTIALGLEPEPLTTGETTEEFIAYHREFLLPAAAEAAGEEAARRLLGVNLDLSHQACEFEDLPGALRALKSAGIPIAGVHVAAALHLDRPAENPAGMAALRRFDEPRYLHQTLGADASGAVVLHLADLGELFRLPQARLRELAAVRIHFHAPLFAELGGDLGLRTTAPETRAALETLAREGMPGHLVVETYTWPVLSGVAGSVPELGGLLAGAGEVSLEENIARELAWTAEALRSSGG